MTSSTHSFTFVPRGPFSLAEAGTFGHGAEPAGDWPGGHAFDPAEGVLRLALVTDDLRGQVGVALHETASGVHGIVTGLPAGSPVEPVSAQVARILSLDGDAPGSPPGSAPPVPDGVAFAEVGARDPLVGRVQAAAPGLRPVLFGSPYEAALWCVLSQRWGRRQALAARERIARELGRGVEVGGVAVAALPTPEQLLAAPRLGGLPEIKDHRLRAVARAATEGVLDPAALRAADPAEARARLRSVPGLGEFAARLVHLRATGVRDVPVTGEPRLAALVAAGYGLRVPARPEELERVAEAWRPFRTWTGVLLRAAGRRLPELAGVPEPETGARPRRGPEPLALIG